MKVRIAMRGWAGTGPAETAEDVIAGIRMPWIELDGHRLKDVASATFTAVKDDLAGAVLTIELLGPVELVYVDENGEPLPGDPVLVDVPANLGTIDAQTFIPREEVQK